MTTIRTVALAACTGLATAAAPVAGQVANPLPSALAMGESYTAAACGYAAVSWNPAALGLTERPGSSAVIGAVSGTSGLGPVTLLDLRTWRNRTVPMDVRHQWLADIQAAGGQAGATGFDFVWAGFQVGRFAAQVSSSGRALNDISPGLAELILMGSENATGPPLQIDLTGSAVDASGHTTGALSLGLPVSVSGPARIALGITAKYTIGHVLAISQESEGAASADPAGVGRRFPLVYTPVVYDDLGQYWLQSGGGFGLDVGATAQLGRLAVAAVAQNVVNRFAWNHDRLRYGPLELVFSDSDSQTDMEWQPLSAAPAELRALVDDATFRPSFTAGAALQWSPALLVTADARYSATGGMHVRAPRHLGAGVQYRPVSWLPLQAGAAWVGYGGDQTGVQLAGGAGLHLGSFLVSLAGARRSGGFNSEDTVMLSLLSHTF
jgi:hypothetical protein